jgi:hypothetical protein
LLQLHGDGLLNLGTEGGEGARGHCSKGAPPTPFRSLDGTCHSSSTARMRKSSLVERAAKGGSTGGKADEVSVTLESPQCTAAPAGVDCGARRSASWLVPPPSIVVPGSEAEEGVAGVSLLERMDGQAPCFPQQQQEGEGVEQMQDLNACGSLFNGSGSPRVLTPRFPGSSSGSGGLGLREAAVLAAAASSAAAAAMPGALGGLCLVPASRKSMFPELGEISRTASACLSTGDIQAWRSILAARMGTNRSLIVAPCRAEEELQGALPLEAITGMRLSHARLNSYLLAAVNEQVSWLCRWSTGSSSSGRSSRLFEMCLVCLTW